jgi:hypothetical protein
MLLSVVMCAKPLRHRNVNIKLYINQIYVNTIIHREFTLRKSRCFVYNGPFVILTKNFIDIVYCLWVSAKCIVLLEILVVWFYFNGPWQTLVSELLFSEVVIRPSSQCFRTFMVYYISTVLLPSLSRLLWYVEY